MMSPRVCGRHGNGRGVCAEDGLVAAGRFIRDAVVFRVVDLEDVYK